MIGSGKMIELPLTAKIIPILLTGLILLSPVQFNIPQPDYGIIPPNQHDQYYEIGYKINNNRDLYIYITPDGNFKGWIENNFNKDKLDQKSWMDSDVASPLSDNSYNNPPLKKEEKIINYWREKCKNPSGVIEKIKRRG